MTELTQPTPAERAMIAELCNIMTDLCTKHAGVTNHMTMPEFI